MSQQKNIIVWAKDGCSYCQEVQEVLRNKKLNFQMVNVTNHDGYRDILQQKYEVRYVPVVEIGTDKAYRAVTALGTAHLLQALHEEGL